MKSELNIDPKTGWIQIGENISIFKGQDLAEVEELLKSFEITKIDHNNGYVWLNARWLTFADTPCAIGLCFHDQNLSEISWSVNLVKGASETWPTKEQIEEEIEFVRNVLSDRFERSFVNGIADFSWGSVWSVFDPKAFLANSGLRYI